MLEVINMLGNRIEHTSFGKIALSALTSLDWFPRFFLKTRWWMFTAFVSFSCLRERMGRANKGGVSSCISCQFSFDIKDLFLCQKKPILKYVEEQHEPSNNCCGGNSTAPTLVHLTPKTAWRISVKCRNSNIGENSHWGEVIAQDYL